MDKIPCCCSASILLLGFLSLSDHNGQKTQNVSGNTRLCLPVRKNVLGTLSLMEKAETTADKWLAEG
jgi:hypothetical protein